MRCDKKDLLLYAVTDRHWLNGRTLHEVFSSGKNSWMRSIFFRKPKI